jgi:antitoxin (DNA-binding transcriptional repressor) of toxin-antitoxin stability system
MTRTTICLVAFTLAIPLALPAAAQSSRPAPAPTAAVSERIAEVTAVVENVDTTTRQVLLRGADSSLATVKVGPQVRNLNQLRAGDTVRIGYIEALVAELVPPSGNLTADQRAGAARARPGQRPGGAAAEQIRVRVRITNVDQGSGTVNFVGPNGQPRMAVVTDPAMLALLPQVKAGDEVQLTYVEAVAVRITPMR